MRYSCCAVIDNIVDGMIIIIIHACVDLFIYTSILLLYKIFSDVASCNEFMNQQHQQQPMTFSFTHANGMLDNVIRWHYTTEIPQHWLRNR